MFYKKITQKNAIKYLKSRKYDDLWHQGDDKSTFFNKEVEIFGIYDKEALNGLIIIENWGKFWEPHIFADESKRGSRLLALLRKFIKNRIKFYRIMIGRVVKSRKNVLLLAKWLGFRHFKTDKQYYYLGVESGYI